MAPGAMGSGVSELENTSAGSWLQVFELHLFHFVLTPHAIDKGVL